MKYERWDVIIGILCLFLVTTAYGAFTDAQGYAAAYLVLWPIPGLAALFAGERLARLVERVPPFWRLEERLQRQIDRAQREREVVRLRARLEQERAATRKALDDYQASEVP